MLKHTFLSVSLLLICVVALGVPAADNPKRYDNIFIGGLEITRIIYKGWEINAHCYYIRDDSNISLYDYDRVITGVQLGYRY